MHTIIKKKLLCAVIIVGAKNCSLAMQTDPSTEADSLPGEFIAAQIVAATTLNLLKLRQWKGVYEAEPCLDDLPVPYSHQTERGIMLLVRFGLPVEIRTPWGEWPFLRCYRKDDPESSDFIDSVPLLRYATKIRDLQRGISLYALHAIGAFKLPEPKTRDCSCMLRRQDAGAAWKNMRERYKKIGDYYA